MDDLSTPRPPISVAVLEYGSKQMKHSLFFMAVLFCNLAIAATENINWYIENDIYTTTTCETGGDILLPPPPTKYGYTFIGWSGDFTPVEYIESTGTQYIDTEWHLTDTQLDFEIDLTFAKAADLQENYAVIAGVNLGASGEKQYYLLQYYATSTNLVSVCNADRTNKINFSIDENAINSFNIKYSDSKTTVTYTNTGETQYAENTIHDRGDYNLYLFASNTLKGAQQFSKIKLYSYSIKVNGEFVRDFIPVIDKNNVPCLYDRIEGKLYYNAGKDLLIAGPIKQ